MNKKIEYNFKEFRSNILNKMDLDAYNNCIILFDQKFNLKKHLYIDKFGSSYISKLTQLVIPKITRTSEWHREKYQFDMWHIYIIGHWNQLDVIRSEINSQGNMSWQTDWDDEHATHYNQNAYVGEY